MAVFQHRVQNENVNILNCSYHRNTFCEKNTSVRDILSIPHILKDKLLASTRSGPLMVYSEYLRESTSRRLDSPDPFYRTTLYSIKRESNDSLQNYQEQDISWQDYDESDDATLDEIMQFRNSSSDDDDEEITNTFPSPVLKPPCNFQPTIQFKPFNVTVVTSGKLPTIFEVPSSWSDDTLTEYLSHDGTEFLDNKESIDFEEMCFKKGIYEDSIETVVFDITLSGRKKLGVLLMHA